MQQLVNEIGRIKRNKVLIRVCLSLGTVLGVQWWRRQDNSIGGQVQLEGIQITPAAFETAVTRDKYYRKRRKFPCELWRQ